jgi:transcriptional regulator with XRE-family HTH domain
MDSNQTPSDVVAARVREVREKRRMTTVDLAARCAELGGPQLTVQTLYKLEGRRESPKSHRPRPVTVDELFALAAALNVAPVSLLVPPDGNKEPYAVTSEVSASRFEVRFWVRGLTPLAGGDPREYFAELPRDEWYQQWVAEGHTALVVNPAGPEEES